jgi:hypothetical protein
VNPARLTRQRSSTGQFVPVDPALPVRPTEPPVPTVLTESAAPAVVAPVAPSQPAKKIPPVSAARAPLKPTTPLNPTGQIVDTLDPLTVGILSDSKRAPGGTAPVPAEPVVPSVPAASSAPKPLIARVALAVGALGLAAAGLLFMARGRSSGAGVQSGPRATNFADLPPVSAPSGVSSGPKIMVIG